MRLQGFIPTLAIMSGSATTAKNKLAANQLARAQERPIKYLFRVDARGPFVIRDICGDFSCTGQGAYEVRPGQPMGITLTTPEAVVWYLAKNYPSTLMFVYIIELTDPKHPGFKSEINKAHEAKLESLRKSYEKTLPKSDWYLLREDQKVLDSIKNADLSVIPRGGIASEHDSKRVIHTPWPKVQAVLYMEGPGRIHCQQNSEAIVFHQTPIEEAAARVSSFAKSCARMVAGRGFRKESPPADSAAATTTTTTTTTTTRSSSSTASAQSSPGGGTSAASAASSSLEDIILSFGNVSPLARNAPPHSRRPSLRFGSASSCSSGHISS